MTSDTDTISRCFERVAQSAVDLTPLVYEKFVESMPQAIQRIDYMDDRMRGRMLDQIYKLLLGDVDSGYLAFETDMHRGYGADITLYRGILESVRDAVKGCLQDTWSGEEAAAWDRSIRRITGEIEQLVSHRKASTA